jgi:DNA processing protein
VGTRNPAGNSLNALKGIIGDICKYNTTVISGFAVGIDIAAHLTAIQSGGKTAAVLGCGVDYADYPPDNKKYRNIIEENGVFISEFLPTAKPAPHFFPQRNRILSGLSLGTVVVEAGAKSGALVTAGLALGQGRDIFCFSPPAYNNKEFAGNIGLLRDGAIPVYDSRDILYEYYESHSHKLSNAQGDYLTEKSLDKFVNSLKSKRPEPAETEIPANAGADIASLVFNDDERRIIELLRNSPAPLRSDDICAGCKMSVSDVLTILTDLEMSGAVAQGAGRTYKIND